MKDVPESLEVQISADGRRLRLVHGPSDVVVTAEGEAPARMAAFARIRATFAPLLAELAAELPRLRGPEGAMPAGAVARRMVAAIAPFAGVFVTPMAAVAGATADHLLAAALQPGHGLTRLSVNNGGDIALWQGAGAVRIAICDDPRTGRAGGRIELPAEAGIGGVATSGWRGRSFSRGIADAVTVLADTAACADVAATLIANAVDLPGHGAITRAPARTLFPDSDLGAIPVTTDVGALSAADCEMALDSGCACAETFRARGLIRAAYLSLGEHRRTLAGKELSRA